MRYVIKYGFYILFNTYFKLIWMIFLLFRTY